MGSRGGGRVRVLRRLEDIGSSGHSQHVDDSSSRAGHIDSSSASREPLWVSNQTLMPHGAISRKLKVIFEQIPCDEGYTWKCVPEETKRTYFKELEKYFEWDKSKDDRIYTLFCVHASNRYKNWVHKFKKTGKKSIFISEEVWPSWLAHWDSEDFRKKSEQARKNRMAEPDGPGTGISKHKAGTRCAEEHALHIAKERGIPRSAVSYYDVFTKVHNVKGVASCSKAIRINEDFHQVFEQLSQPEPGTNTPTPVDKSKVYLDVAGVKNKRHHLFGVGSVSKALRRESSPPSPELSLDAQEQLREQIIEDIRAQVTADVRAQVIEEVRAQVREEMGDQMVEEVRAQVVDEVRTQVREDVRAQVAEEVRAQVAEEVRAQVREKVQARAKKGVRT